MDGASTFFRSEMYALSNICSDRKQMFCGIIYSSLSIRNAYCFSQKNICNQSENVSEYISMLQKYKNNSLSVRTIFPVPANMHFEGTLESFWTKPHLEINIVYARSVGEIFPPYTLYTRTRGRPFWGGYVCSRGCLSNLRMLMEDAIFNTKYHLLSLQEFIWKDILSSLAMLGFVIYSFCRNAFVLYSSKKKISAI